MLLWYLSHPPDESPLFFLPDAVEQMGDLWDKDLERAMRPDGAGAAILAPDPPEPPR